MLLILLTAGAACALGAFFISLRMDERGRTQRSGALFVVMLALLLANLFAQWGVVFGVIAIVAALAYAVFALRNPGNSDRQDDD